MPYMKLKSRNKALKRGHIYNRGVFSRWLIIHLASCIYDPPMQLVGSSCHYCARIVPTLNHLFFCSLSFLLSTSHQKQHKTLLAYQSKLCNCNEMNTTTKEESILEPLSAFLKEALAFAWGIYKKEGSDNYVLYDEMNDHLIIKTSENNVIDSLSLSNYNKMKRGLKSFFKNNDFDQGLVDDLPLSEFVYYLHKLNATTVEPGEPSEVQDMLYKLVKAIVE